MENIKMLFRKNNLLPTLSILIAITILLTGYTLGFSNGLSFEQVEEMPNFQEILCNNLFLDCIMIIGSISVGLLSLIILGINGFYLGAAVRASIHFHGLLYTVRILLPHAIFEIPAIILSSSFGFLFLLIVFKKGQNKGIRFMDYKNYFLKSCMISAILFIIAAIVEVTFSMP